MFPFNNSGICGRGESLYERRIESVLIPLLLKKKDYYSSGMLQSASFCLIKFVIIAVKKYQLERMVALKKSE